MSVVIKLENVVKKYRNGICALKGISFEVKTGEFVIIMGPSGSGKSTTLRCINRMIDTTSGSIYIDSTKINGISATSMRVVRRKIGMVFQHYNLVPRLNVLQNILHGRLGYMTTLQGIMGHYTEEDKLEALELIERVGLTDYIYNRVSELSGGQQQRVGIARALIQNPFILLCDEPISSLDPSNSKIIMDMIHKFSKERNIACIINMHQIDVALEYATRIIGLSDGKICYDGPPELLTKSKIEEIYGTSIENLIISREISR